MCNFTANVKNANYSYFFTANFKKVNYFFTANPNMKITLKAKTESAPAEI